MNEIKLKPGKTYQLRYAPEFWEIVTEGGRPDSEAIRTYIGFYNWQFVGTVKTEYGTRNIFYADIDGIWRITFLMFSANNINYVVKEIKTHVK